MNKEVNIKPLLINLMLMIFQGICYKISVFLEGDANLIGNLIDQKTPFNIYFIIPYVFWYFMLFIAPYYIYEKDTNSFAKYVINYIIIVIISNIIFVCYPTTVLRPIVTGNSVIENITNLVFYIDTPIRNCFPSLHCSISMLWILHCIFMKKKNKYMNIFIILSSLTIMASTLFIKQHVFIDLISGCAIASLIFFITYKNKYLINKVKKMLKI